MSTMRIGLIYMGRHGPGGPISFELASHLSRKADLFAVVSEDADHIGYWRRSGLKILAVPTFRTYTEALFSCLSQARVRKLASQISSMRPDVLLYPMIHPWTPSLQKTLADIPDVVTVHDPAAHPGIVHRMSSFWERRSAQRASRCVVLAQTFLEQMQARGIAKEKIDVIPQAVFSFYDKFTENTENSRTARSILFFGRITQYKGLDVLIQAFRICQARWPDLRLSIAGEGDMRPYRRLLDGAKNVTVLNRWVEDAEVPGIFQSSDIVVVPYTSASQSSVIVLAASFRRPVIASRVGAIPEQIRDGETGILVDPGSAEALASAIERSLTDAHLREAIAERLSLEMRANSNWSVTSDAYLESCRRAVLEPGKAR